MRQLAADGRLDGRLAAVRGYWAQFALPCPFMPHQPVILGFCSGGSFADTPEAARAQGGSVYDPVPIAVPEAANGDQLWSIGGLLGGAPAQVGSAGAVVLIVHAGDSRAWQCAPDDRASCRSRLVIDSVAWVNGQPTSLNPANSGLPVGAVTLTPDQVAAIGVRPGEQLVTAYPLRTTDINEVDPRLIGQGSGVVWYLRLATGTAGVDGISDGVVRLVNDSASSIGAELPLAVDPSYVPARIVLDAQGWDGNGDTYPRFAAIPGESVVAAAGLDSSSTPLVLEPSDYTVRAFIGDPTGAQVTGPTCGLPLTLAAGSDAAYYANFARNKCTWLPGTWPF